MSQETHAMTEETREKLCANARQELAEHFGKCGPLMAALGDETRQAIVLALLNSDEEGLRVGEITKLTNLSRPAVSHHLKVLKDAGAVTMRKHGTMNFYRLDESSPAWQSLWQFSDSVRTTVLRVRRVAEQRKSNG